MHHHVRIGSALVSVTVFLCVAALGLFPARSSGQDPVPLPEPDITYFGEVPPGRQVAIDHSFGRLAEVTSDGTGSYVLTVRVVQPVVTPTPALPPDGTAYVGDSATVLVDGIAQGQVSLEERGAIYQLDIPAPVSVPEPDTILNPQRVVPSIPTAAPTPTGGVEATMTPNVPTGTPSGVITPTPTPTPEISGCVGDCDGNGQVAINELIRGVNIALGNAALELCIAMDANGNGAVAINELITAVRNALDGCPEGT